MTSPSCFSTPVPLHGGPDAAGVPVFDFSTNSNACGPCPEALHAVQSADATRYPDPAYTALREGLGAFHGVTPARIVLAAVDLSPGMEILAEQLRVHVRNVLETHPGMRLACVNVLKTARIGMNYPLDDSGRNIHVQRLVELKEWARPLGEWAEQVTFHVLEHPDPAAALIEYVRSNHVDHVLIGARASSTLRRYLGSVSSQVVAEAPCTVTVVRVSSTNLAHLENANAIEPEVADT